MDKGLWVEETPKPGDKPLVRWEMRAVPPPEERTRWVCPAASLGRENRNGEERY